MTRVAIVNPEGEVEQLYTSGHHVEPEGAYAPDNTRTVVHIREDLDNATFKILRYF